MVSVLKRPGSRLLYLTAELYEQGLITENQKVLLKRKSPLLLSWSADRQCWTDRILQNDTNLMSAAEVIVDSNVLKQGLKDFALRLESHAQEEEKHKKKNRRASPSGSG